MKKDCNLSKQVTYGLPHHLLPWNLKSTPFRNFFEQSSRKKWVKFFFQKTCSIYSTMVPFLVFYETGNINIFIRSIYCAQWCTLNQFQDNTRPVSKSADWKFILKFWKIVFAPFQLKLLHPLSILIKIMSTNYHDKAKQIQKVFFRMPI